MIDALKNEICQANLDLVREGLVVQTWGNVSGVDRAQGLMVIKPSGVAYASLKPEQMVVVSLESGQAVEGSLRPSSDTPTHLVLYRKFAEIGGIAHTHSLFATAWAQAGHGIPVFGTTHADYWHGEVPVTRTLQTREIKLDYEANTGNVIVERFKHLDPLRIPAALVAGHGPFAWGKNAAEAVHNAAVLEFVARLAAETLRLNPAAGPIQPALLDAHFFRKHGPGSYYGQT
ncbi:MAG: L-ribulose-5-phosphate 4-epimerase AraD [Verrucomicrobiota bacterium]